MFVFNFLLFTYLLELWATVVGQNDHGCHELPSWISDNPAFKNPRKINSLPEGFGSIVSNTSENTGWVVELNSEPGCGIEIVLEELQLGTDENDYLILAGWPISTTEFKQIKLYTGKLSTAQTFRILNSKMFFILFNAEKSKIPPKMVLNYKRYGNPYTTIPATTEAPVKKDTVHGIYLKGRRPDEYFDENLRIELKEAIRTTAKEFCVKNDIKFNDSIPTDEMVTFHGISLCPLDWPDSDICVSLEHAVHVSGEKVTDTAVTLNYELTVVHLRDMWLKCDLAAIQKLGIVLFEFPETTDVFAWWIVVVAITIASSLTLVLFFWKADMQSRGTRKSSTDLGSYEVVTKHQKRKVKQPRRQKNKPFMLKSPEAIDKSKLEGTSAKSSNVDNLINSKEDGAESSHQPAIKNYIGSLFFSNSGFENDDGETTAV